jgi:predicted nucleic acid-binding Zn ribbon protein
MDKLILGSITDEGYSHSKMHNSYYTIDKIPTEEMQKCPLCQTGYNYMTKVCPLKHCSNCGSLKLQTHKKRSFQTPRAKQNFIFILPPLGFFVLVYGYLFVQGDLILFLSIVAVYSVFFISILFKITIKNINCKECNARNFPFVIDVNLNLIKQNRILIDDEDLTKKIAKTILEGLSKEQKKHNKKDIIIRIVGAVSLVIIAILGTFFVNPDDILLGELIDTIKSFQ